jgi:hypothetical protein
LRFIRLLFCYNFVQSKTNRRRANEPQRHDIMAEDENTSGLVSACGGMCERSADGEAKEINNNR